jgi:hypothetical protein
MSNDVSGQTDMKEVLRYLRSYIYPHLRKHGRASRRLAADCCIEYYGQSCIIPLLNSPQSYDIRTIFPKNCGFNHEELFPLTEKAFEPHDPRDEILHSDWYILIQPKYDIHGQVTHGFTGCAGYGSKDKNRELYDYYITEFDKNVLIATAMRSKRSHKLVSDKNRYLMDIRSGLNRVLEECGEVNQTNPHGLKLIK